MENDYMNKKPTRTTVDELFITFPYHQHGTPISVPLVSKCLCNGQYKIYRKNTNLYCFEYILSGTQYVITDKKYKVSAGDFCIIPSGKHLYYADKSNPPTKISINVFGNFVENLLNSYHIIQTVVTNTKILPIMENLLIFAKQNPDYFSFCKETALTLHQIISLISDQEQPEQAVPIYLIQAKELIERNFQEKINLDNIAYEVGISKPQLIKAFKKYYNVTPYNYLLDRKIQMAKVLLTGTNLSIKEISYKLKFSDEYYFSNIFKKKVGISPSKYSKSKNA